MCPFFSLSFFFSFVAGFRAVRLRFGCSGGEGGILEPADARLPCLVSALSTVVWVEQCEGVGGATIVPEGGGKEAEDTRQSYHALRQEDIVLLHAACSESPTPMLSNRKTTGAPMN